ncbi:MAG: hypothetical protein HON40_02185 [Flavobacteriales bacterium]|mgnify:FL=1|jgi:hypothetical protein|nr:hypothetical protein [Flavobacteriales bacterium]
MKKLLLLLITLTILANISYASFPITENNTVLTTTNFAVDHEDDEDNEPSLIILILRGLLVLAVLGTALFFIIRTWWRGWKKRNWWARKLVPLVLLCLLPTFLVPYVGHLISIALLILLGLKLLIRFMAKR